MRRKPLYLLLGLSVLLLFASCKVGKRYVRPDLNLPEKLDSLQPVDSFSIAEKRWWEVYADTTLQRLIEKALVYNKDMKAAAARVRELAAQKHIETANLLPSIGFLGYADKEAVNYGGHDYSNDPELGSKISFAWEVDLWGNLRWARERSLAQFLGSVEAQRALQMSIVAQVAQAYFELVALDNELAIVRQTLDARREGVRLAKIRFEGGLTSETSYQQAEVEYARTATLVPDLERK
ncbi:MAG: TolC family protein, partial [Prevotellaceae bacterium]|nr:TolC family protein [Prevotellaceae bacterium]